MPRAARSPQEVELSKKKILDTALEFIIKEGFHNLSMRKLASRLNMTATTIYNYFSNKDEINLMIRMYGFDMLYRKFKQCFDEHSDPCERVEAMIRSYFDFGTSYPNYYDIMFNLHTPKYLDYVETDLEPVARIEKEASLRTYDITREAIAELNKNGNDRNDEEIMLLTVQLWCDAHGVISLYNSKLFQEINDNPEGLISQLIDVVIKRILK
jgi:AcrR family transcriptional regulator